MAKNTTTTTKTSTGTAATKTSGKGFAAKKAPAKRKDALTALADATVAAKGAGKARAAKTAGAARSAAAKRAEPTGAKKAAAPKLNGDLLAMRTAKNLKQLRVVLDEFPKAVKFSTSTKVADTIILLNVRGKPIAEVTLADKK